MIKTTRDKLNSLSGIVKPEVPPVQDRKPEQDDAGMKRVHDALAKVASQIEITAKMLMLTYEVQAQPKTLKAVVRRDSNGRMTEIEITVTGK